MKEHHSGARSFVVGRSDVAGVNEVVVDDDVDVVIVANSVFQRALNFPSSQAFIPPFIRVGLAQQIFQLTLSQLTEFYCTTTTTVQC